MCQPRPRRVGAGQGETDTHVVERDWPTIGRSDELTVVLESLTRGRGCVIAGAPGIGKTALATLAGERLISDGWTVSRHTATAARQRVPFAPFAGLVGGAEGDHFDRVQAAAAAFNGSNVAVVVDDVQWLDDVSIAFIELLLDTTDVRLVLTMRSGERVDGAVAGWWRSGTLDRIDLQPLGRPEVAILLATRLPGASISSLASTVFELSSGNPMFVRELVRAGLSSGSLRVDDGSWELKAPPIDALDELLGERLREVEDPDEQHVLNLLAVADELGLRALDEAIGPDAASSLERIGLVSMTESGRRVEVRIAHPVYGELVRAELGVTGRRALRKQALGLLESTGLRRSGDPVRAAMWRIELGEPGDPIALLAIARRLAGEQWLASGGSLLPASLPTVLRLATAAFDAGGGFDAAELLARVHGDLGNERAALDAIAHMETLAVSDDEYVRAVQLRATVTMLYSADVALAHRLLDDAERRVSDPRCRRAIDTIRAFVHLTENDVVAAHELAVDVVRDPAASPSDRLQALFVGSGALTLMGRSQDALDLLDALTAELATEPDNPAGGLLLAVRFIALGDLGRFDQAENLGAMTMRIAEVLKHQEGVAAFSAFLAYLELDRGAVHRCADRAREALALVGKTDRMGVRRLALTVYARALAMTGDVEVTDAAVVLDEMRSVRARMRVFAVNEVRAEAAVLARQGRTSDARAALEAAADRMIAGGQLHSVAVLLHDLVRLGHREHASRLADCAARCQGELMAIIAAYGAGIARGDGVALDEVAVRFEELGALLCAAEASAGAARLHETARLHARAAESSRRARALAVRCSAWSPALEDLPAAVVGLTKREREIATLAASGLSDKAIAARVSLSVRTVQSHLYAAYGKLGITSRDELREALGTV